MKITRKRTIIISVIAVLLIAGVIFLPAVKNVLNAENGGNLKDTNKETAAIANEDEIFYKTIKQNKNLLP